ncbi:MAG: hypothetical protein ABIG39_01110 [Candidatus Micrarchaeota archaeon]
MGYMVEMGMRQDYCVEFRLLTLKAGMFKSWGAVEPIQLGNQAELEIILKPKPASWREKRLRDKIIVK